MKMRELSDDVTDADGATPAEVVGLLSKFKPGECWERSFRPGPTYSSSQLTVIMNMYIERLKREGLDIGKGNSQFGYRMPLPTQDISTRYLQIFRRR